MHHTEPDAVFARKLYEQIQRNPNPGPPDFNFISAIALSIKQYRQDAESSIWDQVVRTCQRAWPDEPLHWSESPTELITRLIDERDEAQDTSRSVNLEGK